MSDDEPAHEPLLARWSRLKKEAAAAPASPPAEAGAPETQAEPVTLPPIESLTPESDFSPFMQARVRPELRQAALRKLFTDPHFNVMDGLDIYIDDYTKPDPIAASVVSELAQFRNLDGLPSATSPAEAQRAEAAVENACAPAADQPPAAPESAPPDPDEPVPSDGLTTDPAADTKSQTLRPIDQFVPPAAD